MSASPQIEEREEIEPSTPPSQEHKDHMETGNLLVRWAHETRAILVMEFIREQHLSGRLNAFLKRKTR